MATKRVLLLATMALLSSAGCVKHAPTTQIVCTRPSLNEKAVLVTVAPIPTSGGPSELFNGTVETAVQTWLRGQGARTVEESPYDFHVFSRVSVSSDTALGVATVTLKMISAKNEVVANGAGTSVYSGGARDGFHSDMQAVGHAALLAAENLCMTRELEYISMPPQAVPYRYDAYDGYAYGYLEMYPPPFYRGFVHIRSAPRVRHRHDHHHHHLHHDRRRGHPRR